MPSGASNRLSSKLSALSFLRPVLYVGVFFVAGFLLFGYAQSAQAAITYVGGAEGSGNSADYAVSLTGLTGGSDSAAKMGDLVIVATGFGSTSNGNPGVSTAGYTEVADLWANDSNDGNFSVNWKIMGSTPDTDVTCVGSGNAAHGAVCVVHVWRGVDQTTPMDVTDVEDTGNNGTAPPNCGSITPTTSGAYVICAALQGTAAADTSIAAPSGYGNQVDISVDPGTAGTVGIASKAWTSGAEDPAAWASWATANTDGWGAVTLALRPATFIDISGTCHAYNQSDNCTDTGEVKVAINGALQTYSTQPTVGGTWTISNIYQPASGASIIVFIDGAATNADRAAAVTLYDGSGNVDLLRLYKEHLTIGTDSGSANSAQTVANTNLDDYDTTNDADVFYDILSAGTCETIGSFTGLCVDGSDTSTQEEVLVLTGNTLAPGGNIQSDYFEIVGTLNANSSTMTVQGSGTPFVITGAFTEATSTVDYTNASSPTITNETYNNLTISGTISSGTQTATVAGTFASTGTFTPAAGTITVNGGGSITNGGSLTFFNLTTSCSSTAVTANISFAVAGTLTNGSTCTLAPTSGTITFNNGSVISNSGTLTFNNLTIANSATVTANTSYNVNGTLTVGSTANLTATSGTVTGNSTSFQISNSGTLVFSGLTIAATPASSTNASFSVAGALTVDSTKTLTMAAATTVTLNSGASLTNNGSGMSFVNLTLASSAGSIFISGNFDVSGTFTINSGAILVPNESTVVNNAGAAGTITGSGKVNVTRTTATADYSSQYKFTTNTLTNLTVDYASATQDLSNLTYGNLTISGSITGSTATAAVGGTFNVTGTFTPTAGTLTVNGGGVITNGGTLTFINLTTSCSSTAVTANTSFSVAGTLTNGSTCTLAPTSGTITMSGVGSGISNSGTLTFNNITIAETPTAQTQYNTSYSVAGTLTLSATKTFAPTSGTITMSATGSGITNSGTSMVLNNLTIAETPTAQSQYNTSYSVGGTFTLNASKTYSPTSGTVTVNGGGSIVNSGTLLSFNNLTTSCSSTAVTADTSFTVKDTLTNGATCTLSPTSGTITINGGGTITNSGTLLSFNNLTTSCSSTSVTANTSFTVKTLFTNGSTCTLAPSSGTYTFNDDFTNSGTFTASGTHTTVLATTATSVITGASTFFNFQITGIGAAKTVQFEAGIVFSFTGAANSFIVTGTAGNLITITSTTTAVWLADFTNTQNTATYVFLQHSGCSTSAVVSMDATSTNDATATINDSACWSFPAAGITIQGIIYQNDGSTALDCSVGGNRTVRVKVNDAGSYTGDCSLSDGTFTISTNVTISAQNDVIIAYLDGESEFATTITKAKDTSTNITDMYLYQNRVTIRTETTAAAMSILDMDGYDSVEDPDIKFTATDAAPDTLVVLDGSMLLLFDNATTTTAFTPGGTVTTDVSTSGTDTIVDGDLTIQSGATLTMGTNTLSVGGDFTCSGTCSYSSGQTTTFTATSTGFDVEDGTSNFDTLNFNGSGGEWTLASALAPVDNLTVTAGTLVTGSSITGASSKTFQVNNGAFFRLTGAGTYPTTFTTYTFQPTSTMQYYSNSITITAATYGHLTLGNGSNTYTLPASNVTITGNLVVASGSLVTKSASNTLIFAIGGGSSQTVTDSNATKQDLGLIQISANSGNSTLSLSSSIKATKITIDASQILNGGSNTITLTGGGTGTSRPLYNNGGTVTLSSATVNYVVATTSTDIEATTYNNLGVGTDANANATPYQLMGTTTVSSTLTIGNASSSGNDTLDTTGSNHALNAGAIDITAFGILTTNSSTITLTGSGTPFTISGVFNRDSSIVVYNATAATNITATTYDSLTFSPASAATYTLPNSNITLRANLTIGLNTTVTKGSGTIIFAKGNTDQTWTDNTVSSQDIGAVQISAFGTPTTLSTTTNVKATSIIVDASQNLNITSDTLVLTGTSSPLTLSGSNTFTITGSTVQYTGTTATVTGTTFNNLTLGGTGTYTLPAADITLRGNLVVTTNATITKSAANKIIFAIGGGSTQTLTSNATNSDLGIIQISANSGASTLLMGSSFKVTSVTIDASQILLPNPTYTLSFTAATGQITNNGTFNTSDATIEFIPSQASGDVDVPALTYNNLILNKASNTFKPAAGTYSVLNTLTVSAGTLDLNTYDPTITVGSSNSDVWWNSSWLNRRKITLNNSASSENLVNFPVLISLSDTVGNIDDSKTQNSGQDIRFVDADGTSLSHEIEKWDETGTSLVWVKVPQINAASSTDYIWMYYNNSGASDGQSANGVWDANYQGVWHLKEDPTTTCTGTKEVCDSTNFDNDGDANGSMAAGAQAAGKIGGSLDFDGTDDYIDVGAGVGIDFDSSSSLTLEAWAKLEDTNQSSPVIVARQDDATGEYTLFFGEATDKTPSIYLNVSAWNEKIDAASALSPDTWYHIAATYDGSNVRMYINGTQSDSAALSGTITDSSDNTKIGMGNSLFFNGDLDEVRISSTPRTADWIEAVYLYTNDTTKYSYSAEESSTGAGSVIITDTLSASGTNALTVYGNWTNNGTFTSNNGTVVFAPTGSTAIIAGTAATNFYNFTVTNASAGKTIKFRNGASTGFTGNFSVNGTNNSPITISSDSAGVQWLLNLSGTTDLKFLILKDAGCFGGTQSIVLHPSIQNLGNNDTSCWKLITQGPPTGASGGGSGGVNLLPDIFTTFDTNNWGLNGSSTFAISTNTVYSTTGASSDSLARWIGSSFGNDHYAEMTIAAAAADPAYIGVAVRVQDSGMSGYVANCSSTNIKLLEWNAGAETVHYTGTACAVNDVIRLEVTGSSFVLKVNGSTVTTLTDATYSSGKPGLSGRDNSTGTRGDNWTAGTASGGGGSGGSGGGAGGSSTLPESFSSGSVLSGSWTTVSSGAFGISSTAVHSNAAAADTMAYWNAASFNDNQYAEMTVTAVASGTHIGVAVRVQSGSHSGYGAYCDGTEIKLIEWSAGAQDTVHYTGSACSTSDLLRLEVTGSTIVLKRNGSTLTTVSDATFSTGKPGLVGRGDQTTTLGDSWNAGSISGGGGGGGSP
ncbi:MAG: hypothetical protein A3G89_01015 [Candidatus Doudnabacteria bacterium RIFCSPLOWO2_12_FULL_42_9]|nr:MAG: hypothetical protein A3G89_01015 [Candidatus Doudnabacteria bacterium RIFCSPLOWO2_12_FULL_42_9]